MPKLTAEEKAIMLKSYGKSLGLMMSTNQVVSQARTFAMFMKPGLDKWYKDDPEKEHAILQRHASEYFNAQTLMFNLIAGMCLAMEKRQAETGEDLGEAITGIKSALMGPTAGIGDSLFNNCIRIIVASVAISLAAGGNIIGPLFFLVVFGGGTAVLKWVFQVIGYKNGVTFVNEAFKNGIVPMITKAATVLGAIMIGALVAKNCSINIATVFAFDDMELSIQETLDSIAPNILSILLFFWTFFRLKKGTHPTALIFILMGASILLAFLGVF